jgi:hypothetical protein
MAGRQIGMRVVFVAVASAGVVAAALLLHSSGPRPAALAPPWPSVPGRHPLPAPGEKDTYALTLNGITAGTLETRFARVTEGDAQYLEFQYTVTPSGALQLVWEFKLTGSTLVDPRTLRARSASFTSHSGSRERTTAVRFDDVADVATISTSKPDSNNVKEKQVPITSSLDVPAALLLLRTMARTTPPATYQVLGGDTLYEWQVRRLGPERITVPAGAFGTDQVEVKVRKLDLKSGPAATPEEKVQTVQVWLARGSGVPVRVTAELSLGTFQADLQQSGAPAPRAP